jgi:hypothetical protein
VNPKRHATDMGNVKEPSLWSVEVHLLLVDAKFVNAWLNFGAEVRHPRLEGVETWGVDEQQEGVQARAEFLIRAADPSVARAVVEELLEQVVGADSEWQRREVVSARKVTVRPALRSRKYAEDASPASAADYESRLVAAPWQRCEAFGDGRRLRVLSLGGGAPLERVDVEECPGDVTITLLERHPPRFLSDGTPSAVTAVAVLKCAEIRLKEPLAERVAIDGATGHPPPEIPPADDGGGPAWAEPLRVDLGVFPCEPVVNTRHEPE